VAAGSVVDGRWAALGLATLAGTLWSIRLGEPGWFDNEGRFAEAAREMVVLGDYVTPRVNGIPLLTKPPLTQWLARSCIGSRDRASSRASCRSWPPC
jgi:4-amino-4-deoxy-L-arabinose transferase-like glycosyltransferase